MPQIRQHWTDDRHKVNWKLPKSGKLGHVNLDGSEDDIPNQRTTRYVIEQTYGFRIAKTVWINGKCVEEIEFENDPTERGYLSGRRNYTLID